MSDLGGYKLIVSFRMTGKGICDDDVRSSVVAQIIDALQVELNCELVDVDDGVSTDNQPCDANDPMRLAITMASEKPIHVTANDLEFVIIQALWLHPDLQFSNFSFRADLSRRTEDIARRRA